MQTKIDTSEAPRAIGPYSQGVKAGNLLFISGQLPVDPKTGALIDKEIGAQTAQVIDNLEAILKAGGSSLAQVVSAQVFLTDLTNDFSPMNEVYLKRFNSSIPPARVTVEVSKLPLSAKIEIACIASV